ncbi:hypothetical protein WJX72_007444 [[Myrmecia] bisecta]|uniref:Uncharacterized protein n=1 Tax=[Myrmecia] bisecta TaxID=41462 RepID=A0AAW1PI45_9CHLO
MFISRLASVRCSGSVTNSRPPRQAQVQAVQGPREAQQAKGKPASRSHSTGSFYVAKLWLSASKILKEQPVVPRSPVSRANIPERSLCAVCESITSDWGLEAFHMGFISLTTSPPVAALPHSFDHIRLPLLDFSSIPTTSAATSNSVQNTLSDAQNVIPDLVKETPEKLVIAATLVAFALLGYYLAQNTSGKQ